MHGRQCKGWLKGDPSQQTHSLPSERPQVFGGTLWFQRIQFGKYLSKPLIGKMKNQNSCIFREDMWTAEVYNCFCSNEITVFTTCQALHVEFSFRLVQITLLAVLHLYWTMSGPSTGILESHIRAGLPNAQNSEGADYGTAFSRIDYIHPGNSVKWVILNPRWASWPPVLAIVWKVNSPLLWDPAFPTGRRSGRSEHNRVFLTHYRGFQWRSA